MRVIAVAPMHDSPGKKDASGAFRPEARAFAEIHGGRVCSFDNRKPSRDRFVEVLDLLTPMRAECVGLFCHGHRNGLQIGATMRNAHVLAATLRGTGARSVALFACDAARDPDRDRADDMIDGPAGDGGFASALSAALPGVEVFGHVQTAHATKSPHVRVFVGGGAGEWVVVPGSPWWRTWRRALRDDRDFRLSFPLWSRERLVAELARRAAA